LIQLVTSTPRTDADFALPLPHLRYAWDKTLDRPLCHLTFRSSCGILLSVESGTFFFVGNPLAFTGRTLDKRDKECGNQRIAFYRELV